MPDFYSKKFRGHNRTFKGVLSKEEFDEFAKNHRCIIEMTIDTDDENTCIVYFTDDQLSSNVFGIDSGSAVPIQQPFPHEVQPRADIPDGIVDTLEKHLALVNFFKWRKNIIVWSYDELVEQLKLHNVRRS